MSFGFGLGVAILALLQFDFLALAHFVGLRGDQPAHLEKLLGILGQNIAQGGGLEFGQRLMRSAIEDARLLKDDRILYHIASGPTFSAAYVFGVCVLMEMQWMHSTALEAAEFFHGPFEIVDRTVPLVLFKNEDPSRPLMDRVDLPLLGRRRGWVVLTQVLLALALFALADISPSLALPFAFDAIPRVGDDPQPRLGDQRFRHCSASFLTAGADAVRFVFNSSERFFNFIKNFLFVLDSTQREVLFIGFGAEFRKLSRRFRL